MIKFRLSTKEKQMAGIEDAPANQTPRPERDYHQIWEDHLTNVETLARQGECSSHKFAPYLNERPEDFNEIFGFERPAPEVKGPEPVEVAAYAGEVATEQLAAHV